MGKTRRKAVASEAEKPSAEAARLGKAIKIELVGEGRYDTQDAAAAAAGIDSSRLSVWITGREEPMLASSLLPALECWQSDYPEIHLAGIESTYDHLRGRIGPYRQLQEENRRLHAELVDAERQLEELRAAFQAAGFRLPAPRRRQ